MRVHLKQMAELGKVTSSGQEWQFHIATDI